MNEPKIAKANFDDGIKLFVEILKAQPNFLSPRAVAELDGKMLAKMAAAFVLCINQIKQQQTLPQ